MAAAIGPRDPEAYTQIWQSYGREPLLASFVQEASVHNLPTNAQSVTRVYERVMERVRSVNIPIPAPAQDQTSLDISRLSALLKAADVCTFFKAIFNQCPDAASWWETVQGDLEARAAAATNWMQLHPAQLANIEYLGLRGLNLTHLPPEIGLFTGLRTIYLETNKLTFLPVELGQCQRLEGLYLSHNQLTTVPAELGQCQWLVRLDLSHNQLTTVPAELRQSQLLWELDLSHNQLTTVPAWLGQCQRLKWLYLSHNQLTTVPAELGQCQQLEILWLSHNRLTTVPAWIGQCQRLERLHLSHNQLTIVPAELGQCQRLGRLDLSHNQLTTVPAELGQCLQLWHLDLSHNQIALDREDILRIRNFQQLLFDENPGRPQTCWQQMINLFWLAVSWIQEQLMHLIQQIAQLCRR